MVVGVCVCQGVCARGYFLVQLEVLSNGIEVSVKVGGIQCLEY